MNDQLVQRLEQQFILPRSHFSIADYVSFAAQTPLV
jgi:hypothetical protein